MKNPCMQVGMTAICGVGSTGRMIPESTGNRKEASVEIQAFFLWAVPRLYVLQQFQSFRSILCGDNDNDAKI